MNIKYYDNGDWCWIYECQFISKSNNPNDWYYNVGFETKDGGYLNDNALSCRYWQTKNKLSVSKNDNVLYFYVENFYDAEIIIKSLIKAYNGSPYKIYESKMTESEKLRKLRTDKINNINKI